MSIEDIYKVVAEKNNVSEDVVKQVHLDFFKGVKKVIQSDTAKDIMISNFGTIYFIRSNLYAATKDIERRLKRNERYLKEGGNWMNYLYTYRSIALDKRQVDNLWESLNKRANRKKGDRGL